MRGGGVEVRVRRGGVARARRRGGGGDAEQGNRSGPRGDSGVGGGDEKKLGSTSPVTP